MKTFEKIFNGHKIACSRNEGLCLGKSVARKIAIKLAKQAIYECAKMTTDKQTRKDILSVQNLLQ